MSWLEGLLLEPPNPRFITTASQITALAKSADSSISGTVQSIATATSGGHSFKNGDVVRVEGVGGGSAELWNGTFVVFGVSGSTFKYRMAGAPANAASLVSGSRAVRNLLEPFSEVYFALLGPEASNGEGTMQSPFNASVKLPASFKITQLTSVSTLATATTAVNHGLAVGDRVTITGVKVLSTTLAAEITLEHL